MKQIKNKGYLLIYNVLVIFLLVALSMYGKKVTVYVDGYTEVVRTNILTVDYFAKRYAEDNDFDDYTFEVNHQNQLLLNNSVFQINTQKNISVKYYNKTYEISTYSSSYDDLLENIIKELDLTIKLEGNTKVSYVFKNSTMPIEDGLSVELVKMESITQTVKEEENLPLVEELDDNLNEGVRIVKTAGIPNVYDATYEIVTINDKEHSKTQVSRTLVSEGVPGIASVGTKKAVFDPENGTVWDQLAKCESGGNWATNTGNGFYGGLQFSEDTWNRAASNVGVTIPFAHQASREVQIKVAEDWLSRTSWAQWPACSKKLGLR